MAHHRLPDIVIFTLLGPPGKQFSYFSTKTYVVAAQKNRLYETVILSTQKQLFKLMDEKIFTILNPKLLSI